MFGHDAVNLGVVILLAAGLILVLLFAMILSGRLSDCSCSRVLVEHAEVHHPLVVFKFHLLILSAPPGALPSFVCRSRGFGSGPANKKTPLSGACYLDIFWIRSRQADKSQTCDVDQ